MVDLEFVVLEKNELCDEHNIIDNEKECQLAALSALNWPIGSFKFFTETDATYPRGCYANGNDVWFNKHSVGKSQILSAPICRKGKFIYLQIVRIFKLSSLK